jgi:hypothetical protein
MKKFLTIMVAFLSVSSTLASAVQGQANEDVPLPEYYGLYFGLHPVNETGS